MVANDDQGFESQYSQGYHVGSKRTGAYSSGLRDSQGTKAFSTRARMENSLGELTRKFIMLIRDSKDNMSVDLNDAAN